MIKYILMAASILIATSSGAEARYHYNHSHRSVLVAHPACGAFLPCEGVATSKRGERVVKAMGGFGSANKVYHRKESRARYRHYAVRHYGRKHYASKKSDSHESVGGGIVHAASGATAHVAASAAHAFQCVIDALESQGYPVEFMGGFASGGHIRHSLHYTGHALDINQLSRSVTTPRMPANEIELANKCGLISGAQWADRDSGHFQLGGYAGGGNHHYASARHRHYASHRHSRTRYARYHRHPRYASIR